MGTDYSSKDIRAAYQEYRQKHGDRDGRAKFRADFKRKLETKELRPEQISIRALFEGLVEDGREIADRWARPKSDDIEVRDLMEAGTATAVGYADFSNITGQIFFTEILDKYEDEEFVFSKAVEKKQSAIQDIERIAGLSRLGDQFLTVGENGEYRRLGVSEDYIEIPAKVKRGAIVEVTKEAVAGDLTGQLLERCGELGFYAGLNVEKRIIDAIIDEGDGAAGAHQGGHRYTWKGTAYATYQASAPWVNLKTSNALADYTDIQNAWLQMAAITDPYTGEPILINPDTVIVGPDLVWEANRILTASTNRVVTPGYATTANPISTEGPNLAAKVMGSLNILSSRLLKARMGTDTTWYMGNPRKAVRRYYNWDVTPQQRGTGTEAEFNRDVVNQYKVSWKDCVSVIQPRVLQKNTVA